MTAGRCWRCGLYVAYSVVRRSDANDRLTTAAVIVAVLAIALFGVIVFSARAGAIENYREPTKVVAADLPRVTPTPAPTPVPAVPPGSHLVASGESLFEIGAFYGVPPTDIVRWNVSGYPSLSSSPGLEPGWVLVVAGEPLPAPAAPPPDPVMPPGAEFVAAGGSAVVDADDVLIRARPSRDADSTIIGAADTGDIVRILAGPIAGSGYFWFQVHTGAITGWMAAGTATDPWLIAAPPVPSGGLVAGLPDQTVTISGADVAFYDVTGTTHTDLIQAVLAGGPDSGTDEVIGLARISFTYNVHGATDASGASLSACSISPQFTVILPRWVGPTPAPAEVVAWWADAFRQVSQHERRHVEIWQQYLPALLETVEGQPDADCSLAELLTQYWLEETSIFHEQFHVEEIIAGRTWPPPYPS